MSENSQPLDLLGDPIEDAEETRGRDPFEVTDEKRRKVMLLRARGRSNAQIAAAIGCCEKTLRNYFIPELENGAAIVEGEAMFQLWQKAESGNVSAIKSLILLLAPSDGRQLEPTGKANLKPKEQPEQRLGKKEQAQIEAETAQEGTEWADLLH